MSYIGTQPIPKASLILTQGTFTASTQSFQVPGGYNPGNIFVYINGYRLQTGEYSASDGVNIDLGEVFPVGTDYIVEEIRSFTVPDAYTKSEIQNASFDFANMPTVGGDPVVESGSNSDGEWTRWADGTQQCFSRAGSEKRIDEPAGNLYRSVSPETFTFPKPFIEDPAIAFANVYSSGSGSSVIGYTNGLSTTGLSYTPLSGAAGAGVYCGYSATGLWK